MKRITIFLSLLVYCINAQSQLQFAGSFAYSPTNGGAVFGIRSTGISNVLHNFVVTDPKSGTPFPLTEGPDGRIYGVTDAGGANHKGVVYAMSANGSGFTILYICPATGNIPETRPAFGPDGKLYTIISGMLCSMNLNGSSFSSIVAIPYSYSLQIDSDGWVYGIGTSGSQNFIYKVKTDGTGYIVMHTLTSATEGNGYSKGLTLTPTGRLYGVNNGGGLNSSGTLFSIRTDGTGFAVHKAFGGPSPNGGSTPEGLLLYKDGKIWGTTSYGGTLSNGVIFSFDTATLSYNVIYNSTKGLRCGLTSGTDGKLYSVTSSNPAHVYRIDPDGQNYEEIYNALPDGGGAPSINDEIVYHIASSRIITITRSLTVSSIVGMDNTGQNAVAIHNYGYAPNGNNPGALIKDGSNKLYGITYSGGTQFGGLIYSMNYDGSVYTQLYDFAGPQGRFPLGKLLLASDGKLYGLCANVVSGVAGGGIYRINTDGGNFEIVKQFSAITEGLAAEGNLTEGPSGELYGLMNSASSGGACIYRIQKDGSGFTILRNLSFAEGSTPQDGLVLTGGFLYGACGNGGSSGSGTVFRIALNGTGFQVLRHFNPSNNDGFGPICGLMVGSNGKIFGVNSFGGSAFNGTIFSMNQDGSLFTVLHNFDFNTTGWLVRARLIEGSDGKLYGISEGGGASGLGTFYTINLDGTNFTVLKNFDGAIGRTVMDELVEIPLINLPVKLNYFIAQEKDGKVTLNWATSEEENSHKFIVEKSIDGTGFAPIAYVLAAGNTSSLTYYSTEDIDPVIGKNYYRLQMVDIDGSFKYSPVRLIDLTKKFDAFKIYPNPSHGALTIESNFKGEKLTITLNDLGGKTVKKYILVNANIITFGIGDLRKGLYTLTMSDGLVEKSQLIIKN